MAPDPVASMASGRPLATRAVLPLLLGGLALVAWFALWLWSASPWGRFLEHGGWSDPEALAALCRALPAGEWLVPAALHALAWVLMIAAMMLPTTLPLVQLFARITAGRPDALRLLALLVGGFLAAWFAFGLAAHAADEALRVAARGSAWPLTHGWWVGAAIVAGAGAFQFSALKYRCLEECHAPFGFINA